MSEAWRNGYDAWKLSGPPDEEPEEAIGVALITLGREGEFEGCAVGILDRDGEVNQRWILKPWLPSPRNVSDAGRVLAKSKQGKGNT